MGSIEYSGLRQEGLTTQIIVDSRYQRLIVKLSRVSKSSLIRHEVSVTVTVEGSTVTFVTEIVSTGTTSVNSL